MLDRDNALQLVHKYLTNKNLIKHSLAVEAIMKHTAHHLHEDEALYALTGLLHDIDYEYTKNTPEKHALHTVEILEGMVPENVTNAILAHNYQHTMHVPQTALDKALIAADAISGLIIATALIISTKKIADVKESTLHNKYNDTSFARGCNRKRIELCEDLDIPKDQFLTLSLTAMQEIAADLGL